MGDRLGILSAVGLTFVLFFQYSFTDFEKKFSLGKENNCPRWGSNSRPSDYETDALPTALRRLLSTWKSEYWNNPLLIDIRILFPLGKKKINASAGNRTRVNCLEGSYAHHYTTDAFLYQVVYACVEMDINLKCQLDQKVTAVTRIRTWVTAATTQGPNH